MSAAAVELIVSEESTPSLRAAVVAAGARWSAGQRQLVRLVTELDASAEWTLDGSATCAHWVAAALDVEVSTAREWLRIGRKLVGLRVIAGAYEGGRLSYSKLRALTRVATLENEAELCEIAERVPAGRLAHAVAAWLQRHETPEDTERRQQEARGVWWRDDVDGMRTGCFRLTPEAGAMITAVVDAEVMRRAPLYASADALSDATRWPSKAQQRADAVVALVAGGGAGVLAEIVLHVRADGCTLDDGSPIADSVVERIAPDSFLRALIHDAEAHPINASGRQRHPTTRQRRVVRERDRVCVDCGALDFLQYDHEPAYGQSHHTLVDELRVRCSKCHKVRHAGESDDDG